MKLLYCDFETRSMLDLRKVGLHNYARHWSTEPWCMAFAVDDGPVQIVDHADLFGPYLPDGFGGEYTLVAHNATFELEIWNEIMVPRAGWPHLDPSRVICTMAASYAMGLPGALEDAALALGLPIQKDMEGRALVLRMARPRCMVEGKPTWWDDAERIARGQEYCKTDVEVTRELHKRSMPLGEREQRIWAMDYAINKRGIKLDRASAEASVVLAEAVATECNERIALLTDGYVQTVNALIPLKQWLAVVDPFQEWDSLGKDDVTDALESPLAALARSALLLRQEAGKASTAKLGPMLAVAASDDRMRNLVQYHGATTGRWAGRKIQPHNFIRDSHTEAEAEQILGWIRSGSAFAIEMVYGERPLTAISRCLKAYMLPDAGKVFNVGDFSAIEGVGTAWVSGEQWKLDAFRAYFNGTGPDVYKLFASKALKIPVEAVTPAQRQNPGKVGELAFGYQGGVGAAKRFGATEPDNVLDGWKTNWRAMHPKIVAGWGSLEWAAIRAVEHPGEVTSACDGRIKFRKAGSFLWCLLPSGRALCYPYPELRPGKFGGPMVTYMAMPSPDDRKLGRIIADPHNGRNWARLSTYGGSLMENVVQAICRDILADKMLAFQDAGWTTVLHVHDEIVNEEAADRTAEMDAIMCAPLPWCPGFPIHAKCSAMKRYGKPV